MVKEINEDKKKRQQIEEEKSQQIEKRKFMIVQHLNYVLSFEYFLSS